MKGTMGWIDNDADDVVEMIEAWRAGPLGSEAAYEDALYKYISRKLGRRHVARRQFWAANSRADILTDFGDDDPKVAVELKGAHDHTVDDGGDHQGAVT